MTTKFSVFAGGDATCAGGECATVYRGDDGRFYVQGTKVGASARENLKVPQHEDLVEVPAALIDAIRAAQR